jgi:hypothetical protein
VNRRKVPAQSHPAQRHLVHNPIAMGLARSLSWQQAYTNLVKFIILLHKVVGSQGLTPREIGLR